MVRQQPVRTWTALALAICFILAALFTVRADIDKQPRQWTAWAAYWATEGAGEEAESLKGSLAGLSLFAAYFNDEEQLFVPEELVWLKEDLEALGGQEVPFLLTIVNDVLKEDGKPLLKDRALLWRKLGDEEKRALHAREIIALALELGVQGIELDYENLGKDAALWQHYVAFISLMQAEATQAGLSLYVVLEPYAVSLTTFPAGPSYVVMLYNLYGNHSGPGPKADRAFIQRLAMQMLKNLPGKPAAALATGGFVWRSKGQVQSVTQKEAEALARDLGSAAVRDEASAALHFSGLEDGAGIEVWYADGKTLNAWAEVAEEAGIQRFYLWLLGGNEQSALKKIR